MTTCPTVSRQSISTVEMPVSPHHGAPPTPTGVFASPALILAILCLVFCHPDVKADAEDKVDFNRDIRPILSDRCFYCHGPDEASNDSGLRLDLADEATAELPSGDGHAIVPGDVRASLILERMTTEDESLLMPPPESHLKVSERERELIRRWIQQGAQYQQHWAFSPLPQSVAVPKADDEPWPRSPIDSFTLRRMKSEGLKPTSEAQRWRWLRRVTFDLTGLPPRQKDIDDFLADHSTDAYEKVVDRLLESSSYGEHMAVAWLDAARYADSYGYQSDKLNTQWPYRDWVIRAFNDNLPYDQFLTWQIAGDQLENPTRDQRLATAFNRIHRLNNEGGAVFEEWRIENVCDRVHTFGTAVLGLTMECSRCHDHKYDPISQRDYYSLFAFFNSIDENGLYDRTAKVPSPTMLLPTDEQQKALRQAVFHQRGIEADRREAITTAEWTETEAASEIPDLILSLNFDEPYSKERDAKVYYPSTSDRSHTSALEQADVQDCDIPRIGTGKGQRRAIKLDGERGVTTLGIEPFDRWTPFSVVITLKEPNRVSFPAVLAHHSRGTDAGFNGWDLTIRDGHVSSRMYRVWPGNAIGVRTVDPIPMDRWHQVTATYDGSSAASGMKLFLNGEPLPTTVLRDAMTKSSNVLVDHGGQFVIGQRFRDRGFAHGLIDQVQIYSRDLLPSELAQLATGNIASTTQSLVTAQSDPLVRDLTGQLKDARKAVVMAEEAMNEVPIMKELRHPRPAHILARGQYDAPKDESTRVSRDTFKGIGPSFPADASRDRRGLAQWVTDADHPLTARVAINRLWSNFFGQGLVGTPENFGLQGELPTHPELLDWLSRDFVNHDWDVKRICRQIVLSATYRQGSSADAEKIAADPHNQLCARGPAYRFSAEAIRDLALAASGLLNPEAFGPPVSPYQPGGDLWRESNGMSPAYQQSVGKSLYRRSLYSVWKRTSPLPNMMAFDSPSREVCSVYRSRTNTPLQALVLLNDVQFVEACRRLAERCLDASTDDSPRIDFAFIRLTGRRPDRLERQTLADLLSGEREYFQSHPEQARQLVQTGESPLNHQEDSAVELAALTVMCQAILNLDATIWKR